MSKTLKSEILALKNRIVSAYATIGSKGGSVPEIKNSANLSSAIASIPTGPTTPTNPGHVTTISALSDYAKVCDMYGAVLSKETEGESAGKYIIWNDVEGEQTWNPRGTNGDTPSGHGINKAICIGEGIWLIVGWVGLTTKFPFATNNTAIRDTFLKFCTNGSGKENSDYILSTYGNDPQIATKYPLWNALKTLRTINSRELSKAYIPNFIELINVLNKIGTSPTGGDNWWFGYNTNLSDLFFIDDHMGEASKRYGCSSQYVEDSYTTIHVSSSSNLATSWDKVYKTYTLALLSFD